MNRAFGRWSSPGWILALLVMSAFGLRTALGEDAVSGQKHPGAAGNVINFSELAASERAHYSAVAEKAKPARIIPKRKLDVPKDYVPNVGIGPTNGHRLPPGRSRRIQNSSSQTSSVQAGPVQSLALATTQSSGNPTSPPPSASFEGLISDTTRRNPDTQGAVGPNHLMITLNSQIRIQSRDGATISTVSLDSFWAGIRPTNPAVFDPRVVYDPYFQRFIFAAEANPGNRGDPGVLVAVSQTSDPTGNWYRYFVDTDTIAPLYADSPTVGFNKDWIVVQANLFSSTNDVFVRSDIYVFSKTNLYAGGAGNRTQFSIQDSSYSHVPAVTYDTNLAGIYLMTHWTGNAYSSFYGDYVGWLRVYSITGGATTPVMLNDTNFALSDPGDIWADYGQTDNVAYQVGTTNLIFTGDARLQNVVYRNFSLWTSHCQYVPWDSPSPITYVNFWEVYPGDPPFQGVRPQKVQKVVIYDPTYSTMRSYPSVAVNQKNDVLVGYSRFGQASYASAAYFFQPGDYTASGYPLELGKYREEIILKNGEATYYRPDSFGRNLWGDWTAACVDPVNDNDLWILQQYAATPANGIDRWGTWWGRVSPLVSMTVRMSSPSQVVAGANLTNTISVSNNYVFFPSEPSGQSGVRLLNPLPPNVTYVSATSSKGNCSLSNNIVVCDIGVLQDGSQAVATVVVRPNATGFVTNSATVTAWGQDRDPSDDTATFATRVDPAADLAVTVSATPNPVTVQSNIVYSILVNNSGPSPAASTVSNRLPASVTFVGVQSSAGSCTPSGGSVNCTLPALNPGNVISISITGIVTTAGQITNTVTVSPTTAADPVLANNTASVAVRVNTKPTISAINNQTNAEDVALGSINFVVGDAETPSANLSLAGFASNTNLIGSSSFNFGGSGANRTVTITPLLNQFGTSTVSIVVTDLDGGSGVTSFLVTVNPVNDPPTVDPIGTVAVPEDPGTTNLTLTGITSGAPNEIQTLNVSAISGNTLLIPNPVVTYTSPNNTALLSYTPVTNMSGSAIITVTVSDNGTSNNITTRTFTINVVPVNDPPTLNSINDVTVGEDGNNQTVNLSGIGSGAANESQTLSVSATSSDTNIVSNPTITYTSPNATGSLTFKPVTNGFGNVTITVTVNDGGASNNLASRTFSVNVVPVNDPPTINAINDVTNAEDTVQTINLFGISGGPANEPQTLTVTATSSNTGLIPDPAVTYTSPNSAGSLTLMPATNATGSATITVRVNDGGTSNNITTRTFTVTVSPVNDPPALNPIGDVTVLEDSSPSTVTFNGVGSGAANETQTLSVRASSSNTNLVPNPSVNYASPNASGTLTFAPVSNAYGTATISVTVDDNAASNNVSTQTFVVTVSPVNDPPTLNSIPDVTAAEDSSEQTVGFNGITAGPSNEPQNVSVSATSSNPNIVPDPMVIYTSPNATGSLKFTPVADANGTVTITVRVDDGGGSNNIVQRTFSLTISPVNDPPTLGSIADVVIDEDSGQRVVNLTGIGSGAGNETQTLTVTALSSNPQIIPTPTVTYTSPNSTGSVRFTPAKDASGTVTITVRVDDGGASNNLTSQTFQVTVNPINDFPTITTLADNQTLEDVPITLPFVITDVETPAANLQLIGESSNEELIFASDISFSGTTTNRTVTIRPLTNQFGSATITITVLDTEGGFATTSFELFVDPVNDPPVITFSGDRTINEDTSTGPIAYTIDDAESPADDLTLLSVSFSRPDLVPANNVVLGGNGANRTVSLTPLPNVFGTGSVSVIVRDPEGARTTNSFVLNIQSVNDAPSISSVGAQTIDEDTVSGLIPVTIGDIESPAQNLTLSGSSSNPAMVPDANITFSGSGSSRFVKVAPATNQNGNVTIFVTVHDSDGGATVSSFPLNIRSINDLPVISSIPNQTTQEDVPKAVSLTVGDVETAGGTLLVTATCSNPALVPNSNFVVVNGINPGDRTLTITPALDQSGFATITVTVHDSDGGRTTTSFVLTVNPVNDPPTLANISDLMVDEDSGPRTVNLSGISSGASNERQTLTLNASSNPSMISLLALSYASPNSTGTLTFTPATNAFGTATITVSVNDGGSSNNVFSQTFHVTIKPLIDPPSILPLPDQGTDKGTPLAITVVVFDPDGASTLTVTGTSSNTGLVANAGIVITGTSSNRSMTITPLPNQLGSTVITLTARDPDGLTAMTSFRLTVNQINDAPAISTIADQSINEDNSTATLAFVVNDPETPAANLVVTARSSNSQLLSDAGVVLGGTTSNRTVRLTPNTNQSGSATVTLTVRDAEGKTATRSFALTVLAVNDPPILAAIPNQTINEDSVLNLPVSVNDFDSPAASLTLSATSTNTTLIPNGNISFAGNGLARSIQVTPVTNGFGTSLITVTLSDGSASATQTFLLIVTAVNDAPTLASIGNVTVGESVSAQTVTLTGIGSGAANETQTLTVFATSSNLGLIPTPSVSYTSPNATGTLNFTPVAKSNGTAIVTVTVNDGGGANSTFSRTFTVTVTPSNDGPTIATIAPQTTPEDVPLNVPITVNDTDSPLLSLAFTATSSNTTLVPVSNIVVSGTGTNRMLTITPSLDRFGTSMIGLTVSDGVLSSSTSFLLTVSAVNDPPTLNPLPNVNLVTSPGNQTVTLSGIGFGGANETGTLSISATSSDTAFIPNPTATYTSPNTTGSITFRPSQNANGRATITVTVNDGGATFAQSFVVNVHASGNAVPTISFLTAQTVNEDTTVGPIPFTVADSVTPATLLTLAGRSSNTNLVPTNNIVFGGSAGSRTVTITPAPNQSGTATITISVTDTNFGSVSSNLVLTVNPVNDPPFISPMSGPTILEDTVSPLISFAVSDLETPASSLTVTAISGNQTLVPNANISLGGTGTNRGIIITPASNQSGASTITVTVSDGVNNTTGLFVLTVNPANDLPTVSPIAEQTTTEETPTAPIAITVGDVESAAANLTPSASSSVPSLVSNFSFGGSGANRTLVITPAPNQTGTATITVTVTDTDGGATNTAFLLTVSPANDPPTLDPINDIVVNQDSGTQTVNLTGISAGVAESQILAITALSSNPGVVPNPLVSYTSPAATGSLSLTPAPGTNGTAIITVTVNDAQSQSNTASRTFTVTVNDKPTISPIANQNAPADTVIGPLPFTVGDRDTSAGNIVVTATSSNPNLIPNNNIVLVNNGSNRTVRLTPLPRTAGNATITVTATDNSGLSGIRTFEVAVAVVNVAPTLNAISDVTRPENQATPTIVNLTGISSGATNETQQVLGIIALSSNPSLISHPTVTYTSPNTTGTLSLNATPNLSGTAVISVIVSDGGTLNTTRTQTFQVTVTPIDHPPAMAPIADQTISQDDVTAIAVSISDSDTSANSLTVSGTSANQTLVPNGAIAISGSGNNRIATITPSLNESGSSLITLTVSDGILSASRSFTLTVTPVAAPLLRIDRVGANVVLSWPTEPAGFSLQWKNGMTGTSWSSVAATPIVSAGRYYVTQPPSAKTGFYQLARGGSRPRLEIAASGANVVLSWPASTIGYRLESSPVAEPSGPWTTVTEPSVPNGVLQSVTLPRGTSPRFFRLASP